MESGPVDDPRDDIALVEDARGGDHAAWSHLVRRHAPRLAAYLGARLRRPAIVESLVAETVVAAARQLGELPDPASFAAWFRRLGAAIAMKWARANPQEALDEAFPAGRAEGLPGGELARLDAAIGRLDEQQRMALELRWRGGLGPVELAEALRCQPDEASRLADRAEASLLADGLG